MLEDEGETEYAREGRSRAEERGVPRGVPLGVNALGCCSSSLLVGQRNVARDE